MTRTTVSRGNRTAGRSRRNGANPFSPLHQENCTGKSRFPPSGGNYRYETRSRALVARIVAYTGAICYSTPGSVFAPPNSSPRPSPPPSLCSPAAPPPPVWCGYTVCGCTCSPRRVQFHQPSATAKDGGVGALSRPPFALLSIAPRQSTPLSPSLLPRPPTILIASSSPSPRGFSRRCSSRELNGERIARRTSGKESTIRPRNWVTRGRSRGIEFPLGMVIASLLEEVSLSRSRLR